MSKSSAVCVCMCEKEEHFPQRLCYFLHIFPTVLFYRVFAGRPTDARAAKVYRDSIHADC